MHFGVDGNSLPVIKHYLSEVQEGVVPRTWWQTSPELGGSPALSMKTSFSPQPLATVAGEYPRSWGQEAEIINFAGDPLSSGEV